jgi:hypothetical protein
MRVVVALVLVGVFFGDRAGASAQFGKVPFRGGVRFDATPTCTNPHLSYFGGPLVQSPTIVPVFWNSNVNASLMTNLPTFFGDVTQSSYWAWLQEYDTVGHTPGTRQAILPGSSTAGVTLVPSHCPASTTSSCNLTDAQVQTELAAQIASGVLPVPTLDCTGNTSTVYMISFPFNVVLTGPGGAGRSCVAGGFCAYHNTGTYGPTQIPVVYGVLMDVFQGGCSTGCASNATALANATSVASHELVEAATDPDVGFVTGSSFAAPAGWADNNNNCGEIADICDTGGTGDTITVNGRTWSVQEVWSNKQGKCTSTGPLQPVCSGTTLTNCRLCSCGDTGHACGGSTPSCETNPTNVAAGACEACTATSATCPGNSTCSQSTTLASDDVCSTLPAVPALGGASRWPWLLALLLIAGAAQVGRRLGARGRDG